ncbi:Damage inducible protein [Escherichia coli]|nr:damage-inducible type I toxin DinQ [Escherichia coli]MBN6324489.1 Damage inducible protein [Escherichia coli]
MIDKAIIVLGALIALLELIRFLLQLLGDAANLLI